MVPTEKSYDKEYSSSNTHCSKVISKVKLFKKMGQTPRSRSRVINNDTRGKVLSQAILI